MSEDVQEGISGPEMGSERRAMTSRGLVFTYRSWIVPLLRRSGPHRPSSVHGGRPLHLLLSL